MDQMDTLRLWLAGRLSAVRVPYMIGRVNLLANVKWALVWVITPPEREGK